MNVKVYFNCLPPQRADDLSRGHLQALLTAIATTDFKAMLPDADPAVLCLWVVISQRRYFAVTDHTRAVGEPGNIAFAVNNGILALYLNCDQCDDMTYAQSTPKSAVTCAKCSAIEARHA